jgi:riboflavin transporter
MSPHQARGAGHYVVLWMRMFYGAHLLYSSLRYFVLFEPQPVVPGLGGDFVRVLSDMGLFPLVKATEGLVGACLIANVFVPLMLLIELPITVNIFYLNTFIVGTPRQLFTGPQELFLNLFLIAAYGACYREMIVLRARPTWFGPR